MATILCIDTSTAVCSAALTAQGQILCHREDFNGRNHAALLADFVDECVKYGDEHQMPVEAVAVSAGPGSYTGLRIGLSLAKGLAYARRLPLLTIDTLQLLATGAMFDTDILDPEALLMPMIDARRMEVYAACYDMALQPLLQPQPIILTEPLPDFDPSRPLYYFGDGAEKAQAIMAERYPQAIYLPGIVPLATNMMPLAAKAIIEGREADLAYCEPQYIKSFQATKPKSRL